MPRSRRSPQEGDHSRDAAVTENTEDIAADLASAGTSIAATRIGNRVALAQAMALGFGVIENGRMTPAAAEISALAEEIRGAISG